MGGIPPEKLERIVLKTAKKQAYRDIRDAQCILLIHKDMKERLSQYLLYLIWFIV
jgi:hypothetical protein